MVRLLAYHQWLEIEAELQTISMDQQIKLSAFLSGLRGRLFKSNVNVVTILPGFVRTK